MRRNTVVTCFVLLCSLGLLAAQAPQTEPAGGQSDRSMAGKDKNKITVSGCLQTGTDANSYVLNNATKKTDSAGSQTTRTEGTPSEMARAETSYTLSTDDRSVDLKSHIGHRIEVTGTLASGKDSSMGHTRSQSDTSGAGQQSQPQSRTQAQDRQHLKVSSVRMISQTCP